MARSNPELVWDGDQVAAVVRPNWKLGIFVGQYGFRHRVDPLVGASIACSPSPLKVMNYPHDVIAANMRVMNDNLNHRIVPALPGSERWCVSRRRRRLGEYILTETQSGPVVIDSDAYVGTLYAASCVSVIEQKDSHP